MSVRRTLRSSVRGRTRRLEWCEGGRLMRKRQPRSTKKRPPSRTKRQQSTANADGASVTRRRDPFTREWVPLSAEARALGFNWRTLRKHIRREPFVRVLGKHWYVQHVPFRAWFDEQRPPE